MVVINTHNQGNAAFDARETSIKRLDTTHVKGRSDIDFKQTNFSVGKNEVLKNREVSRFLNDNRDLLSVIDRSDEAQKNLERMGVSGRQSLIDTIAETAHQSLEFEASRKITKETLREKPVVASLIVLNTGGFRDLLNQDAEALRLFNDANDNAGDSDLTRLAEKASSLFKDTNGLQEHPLNDTSFFKNHPKAAAYLLVQSDLVRSLRDYEDSHDQAETFKAAVDHGSYDSLFTTFANSLSKNAVSRGSFSEDFFDDNPSLTDYVVAGEFEKYLPTAANLLQSHPEYNLSNKSINDNFNFSGFTRKVLATQANRLLSSNHPFDTTFLEKESGLASLLINRNAFREKVDTEDTKQTVNPLIRAGVANVSEKTESLIRKHFKSSFESSERFLSTFA